MEKPHGKEAVKEAIIVASVPLFAELGVDRVSFREIAEAANVNHALITRHFGTKAELVRAVSQWISESLFRDVRDRGETLKSLWDKGFPEYSVQIRALTRIMLDSSDSAYPLRTNFFEDVLKWFQEEQDRFNLKVSIDPKIVAFIFASVMMGSEIVGPTIQETFKVSEADFRELKSKTFQTIVAELQEEPQPFSRFRRHPAAKA
jgi:TetR/AcrR family transcriptional regulator, repressor for neighboring sulfatase